MIPISPQKPRGNRNQVGGVEARDVGFFGQHPPKSLLRHDNTFRRNADYFSGNPELMGELKFSQKHSIAAGYGRCVEQIAFAALKSKCRPDVAAFAK